MTPRLNIYKEKATTKIIYGLSQSLTEHNAYRQTDRQTDRGNETVLEHHQVKPSPLIIWTEDQVL